MPVLKFLVVAVGSCWVVGALLNVRPTSYFLLLTSYFLLLTSYFLLLTSYFLRLTSYFPLITYHASLLTSPFLLLISYILRLASCFLLLTSCISCPFNFFFKAVKKEISLVSFLTYRRLAYI